MKKSEHTKTVLFFFDINAWCYYFSFFRRYYQKILITSFIAAAQGLMILPILFLIRFAFDKAIPNSEIDLLAWVGLGIFGIQLLNSGISIWLKAIHINIIHKAIFSLRKDLIIKLYSLSRNFHTREDQKVLQVRLVQDTERLSNMSNTLISTLLPAIFTSIALCIILLFLNWYLFAFLMLLGPVIFFSNQYMGKLVKKKVFKFQRVFERFSNGVFFVLRYMDLTKIQSAEKQEIAKQSDILDELRLSTVNMFLINAYNGNLQRIITRLSAIIIITVGGSAVANEAMTIGELISFFIAANYLNNHVSSITSSFTQIVAGNESLVTLNNLSSLDDLQPYTGIKKINPQGRFSLESVWFQYDSQPVLEDINLKIEPGSKIAIIGKNGTGKTTILNLILGFYKPNKGSARVDHQSYNDLDMNHLRRSIGVVMQHPPLFSGTINENLIYGISDNVDDSTIIKVSKKALAHDFIQKLPNGYHTQIGEEGVLLSGGECQRLSIARALMSSPKLLILDEPTNHLDAGAIKRLVDSLQSLEQKPAILIISHDKSVIEFADIVYLLDQKNLRKYKSAKHSDPSSIISITGEAYG